RFFHGHGLNNWDMALLKDTRITESKLLQFRFEFFNVFNHAQFAARREVSIAGVLVSSRMPEPLESGSGAEAVVLSWRFFKMALMMFDQGYVDEAGRFVIKEDFSRAVNPWINAATHRSGQAESGSPSVHQHVRRCHSWIATRRGSSPDSLSPRYG